MDLTNVLSEVQTRMDAVTGATSDTDMLGIGKMSEGMNVNRTIFDAELQLRLDALSGSDSILQVLKVRKSLESTATQWKQIHLGDADGSGKYYPANRDSLVVLTSDENITPTADSVPINFTFSSNQAQGSGFFSSSGLTPAYLTHSNPGTSHSQRVNQTFEAGTAYKLACLPMGVGASNYNYMMGFFEPNSPPTQPASQWNTNYNGVKGRLCVSQDSSLEREYGSDLIGTYSENIYYNIDTAGDMTLTDSVGNVIHSETGVLTVNRYLHFGTIAMNTHRTFTYQQLGVVVPQSGFTIVLPATSTGEYSSIVVKDYLHTFAANPMTIDGNGADIDGSSTLLMNSDGQTLEFTSPYGLSTWSTT